MRLGAVYAGLCFVAVVAAGLGAGSRSGIGWFVAAGGKPSQRLTGMEKRLAGAGIAGILAATAGMAIGPQV